MQHSLPVLMYHYVSRTPSAIAVTPECFEEQCAGMAQEGWRGISLAEAEAFLCAGQPLPDKSALFTFDDGFLDNAVYAWPILRKYGHCGVIFAATSRLETTPVVRPTLSDVWRGTATMQQLPPVDDVMHAHPLGYVQRQDLFLSWEEARRMEQDGMALAAHSAGHMAVFAGNEWTDIHCPGARSTTFYKIDASVPWGMPKFKERPALHSRAFIPSPQLLQFLHTHVPQTTADAHAFFAEQAHVDALKRQLAALTPSELGRFETDAERCERLYNELHLCAATLTRELGHTVRSFCWPWGGSSPLAQGVAQQEGFSVFYTTSTGSNPAGQPLAVHRFKAKEKGRGKDWPWLRLRLQIYARPWLARAYAACRI